MKTSPIQVISSIPPPAPSGTLTSDGFFNNIFLVDAPRVFLLSSIDPVLPWFQPAGGDHPDLRFALPSDSHVPLQTLPVPFVQTLSSHP